MSGLNGWNINPKAEGKEANPEMADVKRRTQAAYEWGMRKTKHALTNTLTTLAMSKDSKKKFVSDEAPYLGVAASVLWLTDTAFEQAGAATLKQNSNLTEDELKAMKTMALASALKAIIEGGEDLKRM